MRLYIFTCFVIVSEVLIGQGILNFQKEIHDFGRIKEADGSAEYSFLFVNSGDQNVKISDVNVSCGCTSSLWSKEELMPGDSGIVTALFNTSNRPGDFVKSLHVISDASNSKIALLIEGYVIPAPKSVQNELPTKMGALRMKYRFFNLGKITTEKRVTREFEAYNDSDSAFTFLQEEMILPDFISMEFEPTELQPKGRGLIRITYDPDVNDDLGYQTNQIILKTSESSAGEKSINVVTTIEEYFPPMTEEELENAPKLTFAKNSYDFKKVAKNDTIEINFVLINSGKSELNIRGTKSNCDCTTTLLEKDTLQPGEKVNMKVIFNTKGRRGKQFKNVTIFSNDPHASSQMVMIKAEVGN
ncbi:MAG: DUF1573 domain-containing protein [Cytophagales bacterium]|nr:DUF1573 domain-containing protein [Cytophagales bacterium]